MPQVTYRDDATHDHVVGTDEQGRAIHASEEPEEPARDAAAFDALLKDEIHDLGRDQPAADDESDPRPAWAPPSGSSSSSSSAAA